MKKKPLTDVEQWLLFFKSGERLARMRNDGRVIDDLAEAFAHNEALLELRREKKTANLKGQASAGGRAKANEFALKHPRLPKLDELISGYLARREPLLVSEWEKGYGVSKSVIYRRIEEIRKKK